MSSEVSVAAVEAETAGRLPPVLAAAPVARHFAATSAVLAVLMVGGFLSALVAVVPFAFGSLPQVTQARRSEDGQAVIIENAHPAFTSELDALGASRA